MHFLSLVFLIFHAFLKFSTSEKVLLVFAFPSPSHYLLGSSLAKGLAEAGLEVTIISPYHEKNLPKNVQNVAITGILEEIENTEALSFSYSAFNWQHLSPFQSISMFNTFSTIVVDRTMKHPNLQEWLKLNETFDAVILQQFCSDGLKYLAHHFNAPLIVFNANGATKWINIAVGNPEPPSYIPDFFSKYTSQMVFTERFYNFLVWIYAALTIHYVGYRSNAAVVRKHFPDSPDFDKIAYNVSLVLLNSHESINQPVPYVPNMINIGGYHLETDHEELPEDLKDFMDEATEGVIYFSLGTNVIPSEMPNDTLQTLLSVFGARKEKILWKYDQQSIQDLPKNVKISPWFPQKQILGHPNLRLFITHCGQTGLIETVFHGVPIVGLPMFGDQKLNAKYAESMGIGVTIPFSKMNEINLAEALNHVLNDPTFGNNVKLRSKLMRDRPMKPMDLATFWVKYVIRNKGASHLRVGALDLVWYQYLLLDVIAFLLLVSFVAIYLFYRIDLLFVDKSKEKTD